MRQRTLVIAGLAAVGVAIGVAVPMVIIAMQDSHNLKFEYVKSGGIAGINDRYAFDSNTNIITYERSGAISGSEERKLSDQQVQEIREAIAGSGYFAMDDTLPASGPADYFFYSLNITMDDRVHSVSWVDDFAASEPVPDDLKNVINKIEGLFENADG